MRVRIDGRNVIDLPGGAEATSDVSFEQGQSFQIEVMYSHGKPVAADAHLYWTGPRIERCVLTLRK